MQIYTASEKRMCKSTRLFREFLATNNRMKDGIVKHHKRSRNWIVHVHRESGAGYIPAIRDMEHSLPEYARNN